MNLFGDILNNLNNQSLKPYSRLKIELVYQKYQTKESIESVEFFLNLTLKEYRILIFSALEL